MKPGGDKKAAGVTVHWWSSQVKHRSPPACHWGTSSSEFDRIFDWQLCSPAAPSHLVFPTRPSCPLLLTPQTLWSLCMFSLHCRERLKTTKRGGEKEKGMGRIGRKHSISLFFLFSLRGISPRGSEVLCESLTVCVCVCVWVCECELRRPCHSLSLVDF